MDEIARLSLSNGEGNDCAPGIMELPAGRLRGGEPADHRDGMEEEVMGGPPGTVLVISADSDRTARVADPLRERGYQVETVTTGSAALSRASAGGVGIIVLDVESSGGNPFQTL